ncbi:hypothetical protein GOA99_32795 [Sinorhizobium meliloti]|uniref:hypothetical protein n=1 Tax=Sinorhizobium medicae TaxID=110321 RepID=UPI0011A4FA18|nr:hypothetical protein [Sinorhizobium medicae]MDW9366042.1 hypothetical protein [Sinorhizobium meliloti]MDW9389311.1 hypothetical protein [Sinorhizobium meliloti]TWA44246.1 hypothetical protein FB008_1386 [Sinorhizobium medicae]
MSNDAMDIASAGMRPGLVCHIEIDVQADTEDAVTKETARVLREAADKIEADLLDTGFHKVNASDGTEWGEIYLDFYETDTF